MSEPAGREPGGESSNSSRNRAARARIVVRVVLFVICAIVPVAAAAPMTILGGFLGYAGLVTTQSEGVFMLFLTIAYAGPTVLALVSILWGLHRLVTNRSAPFAIPLLGAVVMPVLYYVCAVILAA